MSQLRVLGPLLCFLAVTMASFSATRSFLGGATAQAALAASGRQTKTKSSWLRGAKQLLIGGAAQPAEGHVQVTVGGVALGALGVFCMARWCSSRRAALARGGGGIVRLLPARGVAAAARTRSPSPLLRGRGRVQLRAAAAASQEELKRQVGYKAVDEYVKSGTVIGLGTGSTAAFAVERVGEKLKSGELKDIIAIPTSIRTKEQSEALGIPLATLDTHSDLDVAIDGADEVDPKLNLVKGGGGALFREKIVEMCAKKFIVIVDESKMCDGLGPGFPVPVEIVPFCHEHTMRKIAALPALKGCKPVLRLGNVANNQPDGDSPAVTDNGNYIVDLEFTEPIKDPAAAGEQLKGTVGVVDHGLFCGMTTAVIIAGKNGITVKEA